MTATFNAPSPKGTNNAGLFLTRAGHLVDRWGNNWGRSSMRMAHDAALASPMSAGPKRPQNPLAAGARGDVDSSLKRLCDALGLEHEEVAGQVDDILDEAERVQAREYAASLGAGAGEGAAATDKGKGAIDLDPDDEIDEQIRRYLKGKVDERSLEQAVEIARRDRIALRDREAVTDSRPENAINGGFGGHLSGVSKDAEESFEREYPGSAYTRRDTYGVLDPARNLPPHVPTDPAKVQAEKAASRTAGGGIGRRYLSQTPPVGDAALASDEQLAKEYPGFENVIAGY
jgi:hypothetical protein